MLGKFSNLKKKFVRFFFVFACCAPIAALAGGPGAYTKSHPTLKRNPSFYIDVGVGIDILNSELNVTIIDRHPTLPTTLSDIGRFINSSTAASLGVGYEYPVNSWFNLGLRVFGRYANNYGSNNVKRALTSHLSEIAAFIKLRDFEYGADLTPSVNIGANQFFTGIVGLTFNQVRAQLTNTKITTNVNRLTIDRPEKRSLTGLRLGFSLEELLSRYFGLYASYIWTGYGSTSFPTQNGSVGARAINNYNLQTHNIMMGLRYYFSPQHYQRTLRNIANHFNRFYLDLSVGQLIPQYTVSAEHVEEFGGFVLRYHQNTQQGYPTPTAILGLGYGFLMHHFYLGAEVLANYADRRSKSQFNFVQLTRHTDQNVEVNLNALEGAFDLKFGGIVAPQTLLIGRVGLALNYLRMRTFVFLRQPFSTLSMEINETASHMVGALRFGAGIEKLFSNNFSLTLNYIYTYYGHIHSTGISGTNNPARHMASVSTARVGTHAATVGFNYYFS